MPRIFAAIKIPSSIATELVLKQSGLQGARWIDTEDFHITLRFIGDVDPHMADMLDAQFATINTPPFSIYLSGVGSFGRKKPRTLWAGVTENSELLSLNKTLERQCRECGLEAETRNFLPHVTLARLKGAKTSEVEFYKERHNLYKSDIFNVDSFSLLTSKPSKGGGPYLPIANYNLGA